MRLSLRRKMTDTIVAIALALVLSSLSACASTQEAEPDSGSSDAVDVQSLQIESTATTFDTSTTPACTAIARNVRAVWVGSTVMFRQYPLDTLLDGKTLWHHQGTSGYWGTCGETTIANTLNVVTGSSYTETDIVDIASQGEHMEMDSGGMTVDDMIWVYRQLLPSDMYAMYFSYGNAPDLAGINERLQEGMVLNVSVYGAMMREGGHTDEGEIYSDHWITLTSAVTDDAGNVIGYTVVDSASTIDYLTCGQLEDIYHGHDGTTILDPTVLEVFGWEYIGP